VQGKSLKSSKTLALYLEEVRVYRPESEQVSVFENERFFQFHGLNPDNDWVRLAKLIPWAELERRYAQTFVSILTMNLWKRLRALLFALFPRALRASAWCRKLVLMSMVVVWVQRKI
jgi:hypothetical protein